MPKQYSSPPDMAIDQSKTYTATIDTNKGSMTLDLYASEAPLTVNNFVFLARDGFYRRIHDYQLSDQEEVAPLETPAAAAGGDA